MSVKVGTIPCYTSEDGPDATVRVSASQAGLEVDGPMQFTMTTHQARAFEALVRVAREIAEGMQARILEGK
jgi:hypothetical protein